MKGPLMIHVRVKKTGEVIAPAFPSEFVVSRAGGAYDAASWGLNRKSAYHALRRDRSAGQ